MNHPAPAADVPVFQAGGLTADSAEVQQAAASYLARTCRSRQYQDAQQMQADPLGRRLLHLHGTLLLMHAAQRVAHEPPGSTLTVRQALAHLARQDNPYGGHPRGAHARASAHPHPPVSTDWKRRAAGEGAEG